MRSRKKEAAKIVKEWIKNGGDPRVFMDMFECRTSHFIWNWISRGVPDKKINKVLNYILNEEKQ